MDPTVAWTNIPAQATTHAPALATFVSNGEWKIFAVGLIVVVSLLLLGGFAMGGSAKIEVE